jgi:hypothetical protein
MSSVVRGVGGGTPAPTLRADAPIGADVDALRWTGPHADFAVWSERLGTPALHERASMLAAAKAALTGCRSSAGI